jgi:hypothetical protein
MVMLRACVILGVFMGSGAVSAGPWEGAWAASKDECSAEAKVIVVSENRVSSKAADCSARFTPSADGRSAMGFLGCDKDGVTRFAVVMFETLGDEKLAMSSPMPGEAGRPMVRCR